MDYFTSGMNDDIDFRRDMHGWEGRVIFIII